MDGVSDAGDGEDALGRSREHGLRGIEAGARGLLNLFDLATTLANDGAHPRVRDDELDGDSAGAGDRGDIERLVVDPANDKAKGLADGVEGTADVEDALRVARDRFGDGDAGARLLPDLVDVLAGLADDDRRVLSDDEAAHLDLLRDRLGAAENSERGVWSGTGFLARTRERGRGSLRSGDRRRGLGAGVGVRSGGKDRLRGGRGGGGGGSSPGKIGCQCKRASALRVNVNILLVGILLHVHVVTSLRGPLNLLVVGGDVVLVLAPLGVGLTVLGLGRRRALVGSGGGRSGGGVWGRHSEVGAGDGGL